VRVLLINGHGADLAYGGTERYVHDLRVGLEARGHSVTVLSAFPAVADSSTERRVLHDVDWRENRIRRYRNHAESWLAPAPEGFARLLREIGPEIVHTSNLLGIGTGIWERARRLGLPVVHTLHDYGLLCPRTSLLRRDGTPCRPSPVLCGLRTRRLARWTPGVATAIGVSAHVLRRHDDFFPTATVRRVIHAPLAPFAGGGDGDRQRGTAPGPALTTLGFIGTLSVEKGVLALLEAAPGLRAQGITVRVAGDGPLRGTVRANPHIEYVGRLLGPAQAEFLSSCDAGIVPSVWEEPGLTFVALEWLAAGRPVIESGRGGLAELETIGGVMRCSPTPAGVISAAAELSDPVRYAALVARLPPVDGTSDVDRWLDQHLEVYGQAVAL
jgi:glycosyltransferase involved in cell wall biosynthesis